MNANFLEAPSSTKNSNSKRALEMVSGKKKGNTWHFRIKMHVATHMIGGIATSVVYGDMNRLN